MQSRRAGSRGLCRVRPATGIVLVIACLALAGCQRRQASEAAGRPGVVLVSLDTLRPDRLEVYGYRRETAPRLAELARDALVFDSALAQSTQTLLSHKSLFAARYPLRVLAEQTNAGLEELERVEKPHRLVVDAFRSADSGELLRLLGAGGYRSAAFTDGGWMKEGFGFEESFDQYSSRGGRLRGIVPRALRWLRREPGRPFFLFLQSYDAHCPYERREPFNSLYCRDHTDHVELAGKCGKGPDGLASEPLSERDLQAVSDHYDGGISSLDVAFGELIDGLRRQGLYDSTLIVVTSDHGEALGEHGQIGHGGLYLEQLRVPLVVKLPAGFGVPPGRIAAPVGLVDLMPTVLEICGVEPQAGLDGRSLLPLLGRGAAEREYAVAQIAYREGPQGITNPLKRALFEPGGWLLIEDAGDESVELFDLATDPLGLEDVAAAHPSEVERLLEALRRHDPGPRPVGLVTPRGEELSEEVERELRALGYLGN